MNTTHLPTVTRRGIPTLAAMPRFLPVIALLSSLFLIAGLAAACGGDGDDEAEPTATGVSEPTETLDAEPTATSEPTETLDAEPTATSEPTRVPAAASPFDSFHYTVDLSFTVSEPGEAEEAAVQVEGDFVAPDSHAFSATYNFAGLSVSEAVVLIGEEAWFREGSGDWRATNRSDPDVQGAIDLTSADPDFLQAASSRRGLGALDSEPQTINGVETRRYHIPKEAVNALDDLLGEEFVEDAAGIEELEMTVWLEQETDALVRAELTATASAEFFGTEVELTSGATMSFTMVIDISQINDPDIEIEPPI